jgi:polysaccharide export outer membrane protein
MRFKMILLVVIFCVMAIVDIVPAGALDPDYRLQSEDVLQITVYEQSDLDTRVRISSTGEISFPLLGKIRVVGLTVGELEEKIELLLAKDYLVNPQVQIFIEQYHVKQVSVLGAVQKPGKYDMYTERETTLLEAIAMAGGFTELANVNNTRIIRNEDGQQQTILVKVSDITKKGLKEKDIFLKAGDIIFVPESFF